MDDNAALKNLNDFAIAFGIAFPRIPSPFDYPVPLQWERRRVQAQHWVQYRKAKAK